MTRVAYLACFRHLNERHRRHWYSLRWTRGSVWYQTMVWPADLEPPETQDMFDAMFRVMARDMPCERCGLPIQEVHVGTSVL